MFEGIDFFSDTVTRPSPEMRKAIAEAAVGDEQMDEDPTTSALELLGASLLGKSAAMFFPTATMANEVAIRLHCRPGDELIAASNCHLFVAETGGPAVHSQVMARPIPVANGIFSGEQLRESIVWEKGPHFSESRMVSVENTTNMGGGCPWSLEQLRSVSQTAKEFGMKTHMDGARFFNAAVATKLSPAAIAEGFDTVTLCLSKGLGCPSGALLVFDESQRTQVRRLKQLMGGALRQSGILAAAGLYALKHNIERLSEDHANARSLAQGLKDFPLVKVENTEPPSNMVYFHWLGKKISPTELNKKMVHAGVRFSQVGQNRFRAVTHMDIKSSQVNEALDRLKDLFSAE